MNIMEVQSYQIGTYRKIYVGGKI